jgi:hypothetical protein
MMRPFDKSQRDRARLLNRARELARTGRYSDHKSILTQLETVEGFPEAAKELQPIQLQLDRLCAMKRAAN